MLGRPAAPAPQATWTSEFGGAPTEADGKFADTAASPEARFCACALRYLSHQQTTQADRRMFVALPSHVVAAMPEGRLPTGFLRRDLEALLAMARRGGLPGSAVWRLSKRLTALYMRLAFGTRLMVGTSRFACTPDEFVERARRVCDLFKRKHSASLDPLIKKPAAKPVESAPADRKKKKKPPPRSTALKMDNDPLAPGKCEWSRQAKEWALAVACETLCRDAPLAFARGCPISQPFCSLAADHAGDGGHVCTREWVLQTE